jgi:hypothetical protein
LIEGTVGLPMIAQRWSTAPAHHPVSGWQRFAYAGNASPMLGILGHRVRVEVIDVQSVD